MNLFLNKRKIYIKVIIGDWGLGIGDWGLGIGPKIKNFIYNK